MRRLARRVPLQQLRLPLLSVLCLAHITHAQSTLRCCAVVAEPFVTKSKSHKYGYDGIAMEYLNRMSGLSKITCSSVTEFKDTNGAEAYSALVENIVDCTEPDGTVSNRPECICDLGVGGWFETPDRQAVGFLPPFVFDSRRVLTHVDNTSLASNSAFFLVAFSPLVWGLIVVLIFLFAGLKLFDRRFAPSAGQMDGQRKGWKRVVLKKGIFYRMRKAMQSTCNQMLLMSSAVAEGEFGSTRQWILNFVIALSGTFLILVYEATMTASLVQEAAESDFRGIQDFQSCRVDDRTVCFAKGDADEDFWKTSIAGTLCRSEGGGTGEPRRFNTYRDVIEKVVKGECKFMLTDGAIGLHATNLRYCGRLALTGEPFSRGGLSFILPKGASYTADLRIATLKLMQNDELVTLDENFERLGGCDVQRSPQLTFSKLKVFFIIAFVACGLLLFEMVFDPQTVKPKEESQAGKTENPIADQDLEAVERAVDEIDSSRLEV